MLSVREAKRAKNSEIQKVNTKIAFAVNKVRIVDCCKKRSIVEH